MTAPYKEVDAINEDSAMLTGRDGFDKATIRRIMPSEVADPEFKAALLTDEQWQEMLNLIDAAPKMATALRIIKSTVDDCCLDGGEALGCIGLALRDLGPIPESSKP